MAKTIQDAMAAAGLAPAKTIGLHGDGKLIRYRVAGDKAGSRNGWAVLHDGPQPFGAFGSWKTGESHTWHTQPSKPLTPAEQAAMAQRIKATRQAQAQAQAQVYAEARTRAQKLWQAGRWATSAHPYIERKHVHAYGIRQLRDMLLIPARDVGGTLHTLQFISADGTKRFLTGGRTAGCYFAIGKPKGALIVCEGFATGASIHECTGHAVAVAFNAGNLEAVAVALRTKYPALKIIIAADDDHQTPGNPGMTKATAAAQAAGGALAVPLVKELAT